MFVEQKLNLANILQEQGFKYVDFKDIKNRVSSKGILTEDFIKSILKINPYLQKSEALSFIKEKVQSDFTNKMFINTLQDGLPKKINGKIEQIKFVDFENVDNNEFLVIVDYCYEQQGKKTVIDFVLYVNGLPLIIIETATEVESGLNRLKQDMEDVPSFAACEVFSAITDGFKVILRDSSEVSQYDSFVKEMLFPKSLLELIKNYVIFVMNHKGFQKYIFKDYQQRAIDKTIHKLTTTTEKESRDY